MNHLLVVIPFSANDAVLAEHLCDFIFLVNRRVQKGHCLLVVAGDVHGEMREKVRLAAQVAFEGVDITTAPFPPATVVQNKNAHINGMFRTAAEHINRIYRAPWLWLEPDCVPLKVGWLKAIADAHCAQPKRYSGSWLKSTDLFLARVAVYPPDAITDLSEYLKPGLIFNMSAGNAIVPRSTKTRLVQEVAFYEESTKINPEAVLLHSDKSAVLMTALRPQFEQAALKPLKGRK